jgi:hypothetical protein
MKSVALAALVVIAVALSISAVKDVGWIDDDSVDAASYRVIPIPQGRMLVLFDVFTGETWHASMKDPKAWEKIASGPPVARPQEDPPLSGRTEE